MAKKSSPRKTAEGQVPDSNKRAKKSAAEGDIKTRTYKIRYETPMQTAVINCFPVRATFGGAYLFRRGSYDWEISDDKVFDFVAQQSPTGKWDIFIRGTLRDHDDQDLVGHTIIQAPVAGELAKHGAQQFLYAFQEEGSRIASYNAMLNIEMPSDEKLRTRQHRMPKKLQQGLYDFPYWEQKMKQEKDGLAAFPIPYVLMTKQFMNVDKQKIENMIDQLTAPEDVDISLLEIDRDSDEPFDTDDVVQRALMMKTIDVDILTRGLAEPFADKMIDIAITRIHGPHQFLALYEPVTYRNWGSVSLKDAIDEPNKGITLPEHFLKAQINLEEQPAWGFYCLEKGMLTKIMHLKYLKNAVHLLCNCEEHYLKEPIENDMCSIVNEGKYAFHWSHFVPFAKRLDRQWQKAPE